LIELLNSEVEKRGTELQRAFREARPFGHVAVDEFLDRGFCEQLMEEFPGFEERRAMNEMGEVGRKATVPEITTIGPAYQKFDQLMRSAELLEWMGQVASIPKLVYDPEVKKHISRRSLAVYFYTTERPARETAPSHGTVYVPRALPAHLREGYQLEAADVRELRDLLTRRDGQIRFLYERELELSEVMAGITRSASFRLGRVLTWPLRRLRPRIGSASR
jgi:hypothetical protein